MNSLTPVFVLVIFSLLGCSGSTESPNPPAGILRTNFPLSMESSRALFMSTERHDPKHKRLFTLQSSGVVQELETFTNAEQDLTLEDFKVFSKVIALRFGIGSSCGLVVVRKSDGALICLEKDMIDQELFEDLEGNIYFRSGRVRHVYKANFSDSDHVKKYQITTDQEVGEVWNFTAGLFGDVFLYGSSFTRIALANGQSMNFGTRANFVFPNVFNPSEMFSIKENDVTTLSRNSQGKFDIKEVRDFGDSGQIKEVCYTRNDIFGLGWWYLFGFLGNNDRIYLNAEGFEEATKASCSLDRVYVQGKDVHGSGMIKAFNVNDSTWTDVLNPGEFDVYSFDVDPTDNSVLFHGLRNADGATIFARLSSTGEITPIQISSQYDRVEKIAVLK